jgi:hypothetical protein
MQSRRSLRLVAGALVLALPLLGSCGFDKATEKIYTPAAGTNDRTGAVDVLSAVVVAAQPGSGTFIASLSNNESDKSYTLTGIAGAGDWTDLKVDPADLSIEVPARGFVNLVNEDPITVSGDITPGQVAELTLTYDSGDSTTMQVPVVYACNYYEGLDRSVSSQGASASSSDSASAGEIPTESDSPAASDSPTGSGSPTPSVTASSSSSSSSSASASSSSTAQPYDCTAVGEG